MELEKPELLVVGVGLMLLDPPVMELEDDLEMLGMMVLESTGSVEDLKEKTKASIRVSLETLNILGLTQRKIQYQDFLSSKIWSY